MSESPIIPIEVLITENADFKEIHSKAIGIIRSVSALVSMISSSVLIWMVLRSKNRSNATHNRIVFGMAIADLLYSVVSVHFNALTPNDLSYMVWNARGNQASCTAVGFIAYLGWISGVLYSCSLNMYYLAIVKYNATDRYIKAKLERWIHGIPIGTALVFSITFLVTQNINAHTDGQCLYSSFFDIPHCEGYKDGDVREGFSIPCGRGKDSGVIFLWTVNYFILTLLAPIIILTCLALLYAHVRKQERRNQQYGVGALNLGSKTKKQREAEERAAEDSLKAKLAEARRKRIEAEAKVAQEDSEANKIGGEEGVRVDLEEELERIKAEEKAVQAALVAVHAKKQNEEDDSNLHRDSSTLRSSSLSASFRSSLSSAKSTFTSYFRKKSNRSSSRQSMSRPFLYRATAYSASFALTWSWYMAFNVIASVLEHPVPLALKYLLAIFNPLQGVSQCILCSFISL